MKMLDITVDGFTFSDNMRCIPFYHIDTYSKQQIILLTEKCCPVMDKRFEYVLLLSKQQYRLLDNCNYRDGKKLLDTRFGSFVCLDWCD